MITWRDFFLGVVLPTFLMLGGLTLLIFLTHGCSTP